MTTISESSENEEMVYLVPNIERLETSYKQTIENSKSKDLKPLDYRFIIAENEDQILTFMVEKIIILKHPYNGLVYLNSIEKSINAYRNNKISVGRFIETFTFYEEMRLLKGDALPKYGIIYLIVFKDKKIFKVGRTFNLKQRYSKSVKENVVRVYHVSDDRDVERDILKEYRRLGYKTVKGNEYFSYSRYSDVLTIFDYIVKPKAIDTTKVLDSYFHKKEFSHDKRGFWTQFTPMHVIVNHFVKDDRLFRLFTYVESFLLVAKSSGYYYRVLEFPSAHLTFKIAKFRRYTIIENQNNLYVHATALWNTIKKADGIKNKQTLYNFLRSQFMQKHLKPQFEELFPGQPIIINYECKDFKFLSGHYIHFIFVHFILEWLDAKYAMEVSLYMYKTFIINGDDFKSNYKKIMNIKTLYSLFHKL